MQTEPTAPVPPPAPLSWAALRALALECGADDASAVPLDHPELASERPFVDEALPGARTLVAFCLRMLPDAIRSPARSVANLEFHHQGHEVDAVGRRLAHRLNQLGHRALQPPMAFPMEMTRFPGRAWIVSHKRVAEAAQLGRMGLHRNLIHPRFGNFILLGTVITAAPLEGAAAPLPASPCVDCKLCVAACPVGAIEKDGGFRFSACYDHNYREFMTGFTDLLEDVAESRDRHELRDRVPLSEAMATWQGLASRPSYKAAYCMAVCPAGDDVIGPFLAKKGEHVAQVLKPLTEKVEPVYVVAGSDAEAHVRKRFPHKTVRRVRSSLRPTDPAAFFTALPHTFQRGPASGWTATFHIELTGARPARGTVVIDDGRLQVTDGALVGEPTVQVVADGARWLEVVSGRRSPVWAVLQGHLRVRGDRKLLGRFAACFPR